MDLGTIFLNNSTLILAATAVYLLYKLGTSSFHVFSSLGIPGPKPLPFLGNILGLMTKNPIKHDAEMIEKYGKVFGLYEGVLPELFIADADLIRQVYVKDFEHFVNRREFAFERKYHRKMMTIMRDDAWKDVRLAIGSALTASKVRKMLDLMQKSAERLVDTFTEIAQNQKAFDVRTACYPYPVDVMARCAFATDIPNLGAEDDNFMKYARTASTAVTRSPLMIVPSLAPRLTKYLRKMHFNIPEFDFFVELLQQLVEERKHSKIEYNDFIDMATEALRKQQSSNQKKNTWSEEEIDEIVISQCTVFLFAGLESVSTTIGASCYLLATHPEIQEKFYNMVATQLEKHGSLTHEMLLDLPYGDYILKEAMRLYSPAARIERECCKDITIKGVHIKKGMLVRIPIYAVHLSEDYYRDPLKFDPDRWDPANKDKPNPYAYLPFGLGPRNCVGMKFSMDEMKIALCNLVLKFRFYPVADTPKQLEMTFGFYNGNKPTSTLIGVEIRQA